MNYNTRLCEAYHSIAMVYFSEGEQPLGCDYARKYLDLAARINYLAHLLFPTFELSQPILQFGLENGVEINFIQRMLMKLGQTAFPFLQKLANHPDPEVRKRIIAPLKEIGGEKAGAILQSLTLDPDPEVRQSAFAALRPSGFLVAKLAEDHQPSSAALSVKTLGPVQFFEEAVEIYKGDYLKDMDYTWIIATQVRLNQIYITTRLRLASYYLKKAEYFKALNHLLVVKEADPLNEEIYRLLMTVYAEMGNRQAILSLYQSLKEVLAKETGLEPARESTELLKKLIG
jgi:tetratricopeptide (TPR) repeat protein